VGHLAGRLLEVPKVFVDDIELTDRLFRRIEGGKRIGTFILPCVVPVGIIPVGIIRGGFFLGGIASGGIASGGAILAGAILRRVLLVVLALRAVHRQT
jgi:hypothetical protein